ncbi:MAG: hypothetical protein Kow00120_20760 [Anaerolineae bacterium]
MSAGNRSCIYVLVGLVCLFSGFFVVLRGLLGGGDSAAALAGLAAVIAGVALLVRGRRAFSIDE